MRVQEALTAEGQTGQAGSVSIGTQSAAAQMTAAQMTAAQMAVALSARAAARAMARTALVAWTRTQDGGGAVSAAGTALSCGVPRSRGRMGLPVWQHGAPGVASAAAAVPACSVAQSAAGSAPARRRHNGVRAAMSEPAAIVAGGPAQTAVRPSSQAAQRSKSSLAKSNNAFLRAAVALGQASVDDVRELEDFVVADPERDHMSLLTQQCFDPSESEIY